MSLLKDIAAELAGMFLADGRFAAAILIVVGLAAALIRTLGDVPLFGGGVLVAGCLLLVVENVWRAGRVAKRGRADED